MHHAEQMDGQICKLSRVINSSSHIWRVSRDIFISLRTSVANDVPMGSSRVENQTT